MAGARGDAAVTVPSATLRRWGGLAIPTQRKAWRDRIRRALLLLAMLSGLGLLGLLVRYGARFGDPGLLLAVLAHLLALAWSWPPMRGGKAAAASPVSHLCDLAAVIRRRRNRLALLRRAFIVETMIAFWAPVLTAQRTGLPLHWSSWFTLAVAMVCLIRPIEIATAALDRERHRLLACALNPPS